MFSVKVDLRLKFITVGLLTTMVIFVGAPLAVSHAQQATPPPPGSGFDLTNAQRATVSITQISHSPGGQPIITCVGSGTLVSSDGLILTNAHFARPSARCAADGIVIGLAIQPDQPPVPSYYADLVEINVGLDLAVLRITRTLDSRTLNSASLVLPFVALGDSGAIKLDDTITALGYSLNTAAASSVATASAGITIARGTISNFLDEARVGNRAWLKTNAIIPGGLSGGGAYNAQGQLIGIPTIEPSPDQTQACRAIQDTNGDGRVDSRDSCVPVGGLITALRPSSLARGLVRAAQLGIGVSSSDGTVGAVPGIQTNANGTAKFSRLLFSPGVNAAGMPNTLIRGAPSGTASLYLFFDYSNLTDGEIYEVRTTVDGTPNANFSLSPGAWSGGQNGLWYIGSHAQTWPNGAYVFTLLIDGVRMASASIAIGGASQNTPLFSDLLFGATNDRQQLLLSGNVLPATDTITAQFAYGNLSSTVIWRQIWYFNDIPISSGNAEPWNPKDGANGTKQISAAPKPAKQPGRYRLEIYLNEQLAATADFIMAGQLTADRVQIFDKLTFGTTIDSSGLVGVNTVFPNTTPQLYATFTWLNLAVGTPFTWRWLVDNNPLFEQTQPWNPGKLSNSAAWLRLNSPGHLPDGSYTIELLVAGISMGKAVAKVGVGQLPIALFAEPVGVQVNGRVIDAETGQPIVGAAVIVLKTTVVTRDFVGAVGDIDQLLLTDSQGRFQLLRLLPRGNAYSVIIRAQGYLALETDGLNIDASTPNPLTINVQLNRD